MVNNKGYIKTLEAVIAIIIILVFVYVLTPKAIKKAEPIPSVVKEAEHFILTEIALNKTLRSCVSSPVTPNGECRASGCMEKIMSFVQANTPPGYQSRCELCEKAVSCSQIQLPLDRSIYTDSIMISNPRPRVFRVYFWPVA